MLTIETDGMSGHVGRPGVPRRHPNDLAAVASHLRASALAMTESEREELLDIIDRQLAELDPRAEDASV